MSIAWEKLVDLLRSHQSFVITSHVRPDCDALGSELGLAGILEAIGKQVFIVNADPTPPNVAFIDPTKRIQSLGSDVTLETIPEHDLFVVVDTSAWGQLGAMGDALRNSKATKIIIDHHVSEDDLGATPFKDTFAEATGRLITELAARLQVKLTPEIATPLFAAMITDTGWLRFPSVTAESYRICADLVAGGASPSYIYGQLYEQETLARCHLRGLVLRRLQTLHQGRLIHAYCRLQDFRDTGALSTDTEDLINRGLAVAGTEVAAILVEMESGAFKVSFRSRCHVDCSQVASRFGGGGHKAAAGATLHEPFEVAQARVIEALTQALLSKP